MNYFNSMVKGMLRVFPNANIIIMNKNHLQVIRYNKFYMATANNDNEEMRE